MNKYSEELRAEILQDEGIQYDNDSVAEELLAHLWDWLWLFVIVLGYKLCLHTVLRRDGIVAYLVLVWLSFPFLLRIVLRINAN